MDHFINSLTKFIHSNKSASDVATYLNNHFLQFLKDHVNLHTPEAIFFYYIDIFFSPKLILRHLAVIATLQTGLVCSTSIFKLFERIRRSLTKKGEDSGRKLNLV